MKKFTESEIKTGYYAESDVLRNYLYKFVSESLTPNIDGIDITKLTISGKEDLVEELLKIVENSRIDTEIETYTEILNKKITEGSIGDSMNTVDEMVTEREKLDPLMEAFKQVIESDIKNKDEE